MWGRSQRPGGAAKTDASLGLYRLDDLLKPAAWESLPDAERAQVAARVTPLAERASQGESLLRGAAPAALQTWLAQVVAPTFQPDVATGTRSWLAIAPVTAHLYVGGGATYGIPQMVASIAREAVAAWPGPSSYCYAPDPAALGQVVLLMLPLGKGAAFGKRLSDALGAIGQGWDNAANRDATIAASLADAPQDSPAAQNYLAALRASLSQLAVAGGAFPWSGDDNGPPVGAVTPEPSPATMGAPVVDGAAGGDPADLLLRANGGVLIVSPTTVDVGKLLALLDARALVVNDGWPPIPLTARVVMVGSGAAYNGLWSSSAAIGQIFRNELWGQDITVWNQAAEATYATFAAGVAAYYGLPMPAPAAIGRLIQEGSRRAGALNRSRLATDLLAPHDLIIEAGNMARARGGNTITGEDVDAALAQRISLQRANVFWVQDAILSGESITPTSGAAVGQINGLGILETHPWEGIFAVPMRISATASAGRDEQVLDIEREAEQTDDTHVRGLLTMEGYFINQYGQRFPLSLAARLRFEQEHNATGGDSASAAELFALLSALSGIPIRRSIAVTGAVGQYGEMQPIGGVNFKIEGFWDLCRARRAQGEQAEGGYGVIIPAVNARDLMLRPTAAQSIATEGWFNIWPAQTADDAIPLLMGVAASVVHDKVAQRLRLFYLQAKGGVSR